MGTFRHPVHACQRSSDIRSPRMHTALYPIRGRRWAGIGETRSRWPAAQATTEQPGRPHAERVYAGLREQLLRGDLPVGRRLVELQLAAEFETSRTPVREALRRLEGDGHIVRDPGGGMSPARQREVDAGALRGEGRDRGARRPPGVDLGRPRPARCDRGAVADLQTPGGTRDVPRGPDFVHADERSTSRSRRPAATTSPRRCWPDLNDRIRILRGTTSRPTAASRRRSPSISRSSAASPGDADAAAAFMRAHVQRSALVVRERVGKALARMSEVSE